MCNNCTNCDCMTMQEHFEQIKKNNKMPLDKKVYGALVFALHPPKKEAEGTEVSSSLYTNGRFNTQSKMHVVVSMIQSLTDVKIPLENEIDVMLLEALINTIPDQLQLAKKAIIGRTDPSEIV